MTFRSATVVAASPSASVEVAETDSVKSASESAGGEMVTASGTGGPELVEIKISPEVVDADDVEMLEDLVMVAVRQAMEAAVEAANNQLGGLADGLDLDALLG